MNPTPRIGFIGQGWIGKNYADDFEKRGYDVVRYALEEPYVSNQGLIPSCDIVFVAVPTPTTTAGFDRTHVESALTQVGEGKIAVIKSTLVPGTTEALQALFPNIVVLHSPEFLRESNAAYDAAHPVRNIVGVPVESDQYTAAAEAVFAVLPHAASVHLMTSREAELVKYAGNVFLALKVVYGNMLYDLSAALSTDYETIRTVLGADPRIGPSHLNPIDTSGHTDKPGRGAGGHCFIKDLEAFRLLYEAAALDPLGNDVFRAVARKNNQLLKTSGKDTDILSGVYGDTHELLP